MLMRSTIELHPSAEFPALGVGFYQLLTAGVLSVLDKHKMSFCYQVHVSIGRTKKPEDLLELTNLLTSLGNV
jgi:hypothetical protein